VFSFISNEIILRFIGTGIYYFANASYFQFNVLYRFDKNIFSEQKKPSKFLKNLEGFTFNFN
jgi:hypothetical protein